MCTATAVPTYVHDEASAGAAITSTASTTPAANHLHRRHPTDRLSRRMPLISFSAMRKLTAEKEMRGMRRDRRSVGWRRCRWFAAGVVLAVLVIAAPAEASSCTYVGTAVAVHMPGSSDVVGLHRVGDAIYDCGMQCGAATVYNTDAVFVQDTSPNQDGNDLVNIDL